MKSTMKKFLFSVLVTVIAFSMAACDEKIENASLEGTWVSSDGSKMVLNNGSIIMTMPMPINNANVNGRGTYSTSGNNIAINITEVSGVMFAMMGLSPFQWYTLEQLKPALVQFAIDMYGGMGMTITQSEAEKVVDDLLEEVEFGEATGTYKIIGNKMTLTMYGKTTTFTKQ